ncbi:hypothetical protein JOL62DRAFT_7465 [Phyllosticta paracitricarpa]|uniref:Uncharacterized protein n=1 Tax=Phyllosticta paracitricarpa TaxID=2016321 RepID=A0ABR1NJY9_9PEZI
MHILFSSCVPLFSFIPSSPTSPTFSFTSSTKRHHTPTHLTHTLAHTPIPYSPAQPITTDRPATPPLLSSISFSFSLALIALFSPLHRQMPTACACACACAAGTKLTALRACAHSLAATCSDSLCASKVLRRLWWWCLAAVPLP